MTPQPTGRMNWPLLALAIGAFGIGVTEFSPMGLLPVIAEGVDVSIPTAGLLVSAYAVGVTIGAPVMTLLFGRFGRRGALMALMGIFTFGNILSALAPDYWTLLLSRIVTSLNHGAFFGLGAVVAASVVRPERRASAVATMFMGLTIANIGGVPLATWIGQQIGWRMAFAGTAVLGLLAMAALWYALPKGERGSVPHVREGRVRAIAVTSARRSPTLPEVPTMAEQGFPQIELYDWFGVVAPARTPPAATERLFRAVVEATRNAALRQRLEAAGLEVLASASPDEFGAFIAAEIERWGTLIRAAGIRADG